MLGEAVPVKTFISKFSMELQVAGDVSFVDMGNGFSLVKFTIDWAGFSKDNAGLSVAKFTMNFSPITLE